MYWIKLCITNAAWIFILCGAGLEGGRLLRSSKKWEQILQSLLQVLHNTETHVCLVNGKVKDDLCVGDHMHLPTGFKVVQTLEFRV